MLKLDFENLKKMVAFKKAGFWEKERSSSFVDVAGFNNRSIATSSFTWLCFEKKIASWATELLGCWAAHHLEQWSLLGAACSTLRRFGWPTASVGEWFSFCHCLWQRFLPTPRFQQSSTPTQLQGRLGHQLQLAQRSFLCGCIGGFIQRWTADRLGLIVFLRL